MKAAILSDAHGNAQTFAACLTAVESLGADQVVFLGDALGYLDEEKEVLRRLRENVSVCVKGNHEAMLLGELPFDESRDAIYRLKQAAVRLSEEEREYVSSWPAFRMLQIGTFRVLAVHGSPANPLAGYVYPDTALEPFVSREYDIVVMGNTHRPFIRECEGVHFMNVGSSGLPRDQGDLASFGLIDGGTGELQICRVQFDRDALLEHYGPRIAREVAEVFRRETSDPVGSIVNEETK